jgi:methylated-DNA-[protein]-cysteine S-methyltransferase
MENPLWIVVPVTESLVVMVLLTGMQEVYGAKKWLLEHENPSPQHSLFYL